MRSSIQLHRKRYQTQSLTYDSLLATKQEADRQLAQIRSQLLKR